MINFVVHEAGDSVGTIVVEGVKAGDSLTGWVMEEDETLTLKTLEDIPIGHKIAIKELPAGATVIKYGVDIGKTIAPIKRVVTCTFITSRPSAGKRRAENNEGTTT